MLPTLAFALAAIAAPAMAQLSSMRATIPGSLHQCEATNLFFYETDNVRPLSVLFLPSSEVPDSLRSGTTTLEEAQQYNPLLALSDIESADAAQYNFELQIEEGQVFELFGFLPDGSGKALSLTRTVQTPLPAATNCLNNVPTSISAGSITTSVSASQASSTGAASSAASVGSAASSSASKAASSASSAASSASSSAASASSTTDNASAAGRLSLLDTMTLFGWSAALTGVALVTSGMLV
ncbi:hypothetical protein JCM11641_005644 [Rhodosporidiobolus odoratus]